MHQHFVEQEWINEDLILDGFKTGRKYLVITWALLWCLCLQAAATVTNGGAEDTKAFPTSLSSDLSFFFGTNTNELVLLS